MSEVFKRWKNAKVATRTAEEIYALSHDADFYNFNSFCWEGQPPPVDGEVGYYDKTQERIVVKP